MKINTYIVACALLMAGITSCIDDESSLGGKVLPELTIAGSTETMPILNFDLGADCVIRPDITYTGESEQNLTYTWSIGSYTNGVKGQLEEVSHERNLTYFFTQGGAYYAHLVVTDGTVGAVMEYQVNMNRIFEEGYVLISSDEADNGNLAFVKILTPEEIAAGVEKVNTEHCLELMNESYSEKGLRNVLIGSVNLNASTKRQRLLVSVEDKCYVLDPNSFTILSEFDYADVFPGFKATDFLFSTDIYYPCAYDKAMGKFIHFDLTYQFVYEYGLFKGETFDHFVLSKYSRWGSESSSMLFVRHNPDEVCEYNAYAPYYGLDTYFPSTGDLLTEKELLATFMGDETSETTYQTALYILARSTTNPNSMSLYRTNFGSIHLKNFAEKTLTLTDDMAIPAVDTRVVSSPAYDRYFYSVDNGVYVMLIDEDNESFTLGSKSAPSIQFPSNEIVTYMDVNISTEELYVATYDTTTKRGNFYIYNTADVRADNLSSPAPKASHLNCADKITNILYKPSIAN